MFEHCLYFNLNALTRTVNRLWQAEFQRFGLSPPHAFLLRLVLAKPGLLQKEIADELGLSRSTITRFIDVLVKRDLLRRGGSTGDGREQQIFPTASAQQMQSELEACGAALTRQIKAYLGDTEVTQTVAQIRALKRSLDQQI